MFAHLEHYTRLSEPTLPALRTPVKRTAPEHKRERDELEARVARVLQQGRLGKWGVREAVTAFHAVCEALAALEMRNTLPAGAVDDTWRAPLAPLATEPLSPSGISRR